MPKSKQFKRIVKYISTERQWIIGLILRTHCHEYHYYMFVYQFICGNSPWSLPLMTHNCIIIIWQKHTLEDSKSWEKKNQVDFLQNISVALWHKCNNVCVFTEQCESKQTPLLCKLDYDIKIKRRREDVGGVWGEGRLPWRKKVCPWRRVIPPGSLSLSTLITNWH